MRNPGAAPKQGDLAKLVSDRGAGRGEPFVTERHFQHRVFTLRYAVEDGGFLAHQFLQRDAVHMRDLIRVRRQADVAAAPLTAQTPEFP